MHWCGNSLPVSSVLAEVTCLCKPLPWLSHAFAFSFCRHAVKRGAQTFPVTLYKRARALKTVNGVTLPKNVARRLRRCRSQAVVVFQLTCCSEPFNINWPLQIPSVSVSNGDAVSQSLSGRRFSVQICHGFHENGNDRARRRRRIEPVSWLL